MNFISELKPLTYSMLINQDKKNKSTVLNLQKLVTDFKLDIKLSNNVVEKTNVNAFISKRNWFTHLLIKIK